MPDATRIYAFDALASVQRSTAATGAGVTIALRRPAAMLNVRGAPDDAALARSALERYEVELPREPNTASGSVRRALWLGPDEWLVVSSQPLREQSVAGGTVTDVSHGRAVVRLWGPDVREVLAKGCPLDLHPRSFGVGRCAQTAIARIPVILDHVARDVFELYCPRSYAGSFWHWLIEACTEFRYTFAPRV